MKPRNILVLAVILCVFWELVGFAEDARRWPDLKVNGIMARGSASTVILNGEMLDIGETISGVKVVSIKGKTVHLLFNGDTIVLSQGQSTENRISVAAATVSASKKATTESISSKPEKQVVTEKSEKTKSASPATGRPKSFEEQAIAEYMQQNPNLEDQLRMRHKRAITADKDLRENPNIAPTGVIFLPHQNPVQSKLKLKRDSLAQQWNYLAHIERKEKRTLTIADVSPDDPSSMMYVMALFTRDTVQTLKTDGTVAGLRFAYDFIEKYAAQRKEFSFTWGPLTFDESLAEMCWMTAGALEMAGDMVAAHTLCKQALAAELNNPLMPSFRYMEARIAYRSGHDFESSEILRELIKAPKSADTPLRLPAETRVMGSIYTESMTLLKKVRGEASRENIKTQSLGVIPTSGSRSSVTHLNPPPPKLLRSASPRF